MWISSYSHRQERSSQLHALQSGTVRSLLDYFFASTKAIFENGFERRARWRELAGFCP